MGAQRLGLRVLRVELFDQFAHSRRAARSLAISMKKFIPMPRRTTGGRELVDIHARLRCRRGCTHPSASVYASSRSAVAPASCMW